MQAFFNKYEFITKTWGQISRCTLTSCETVEHFVQTINKKCMYIFYRTGICYIWQIFIHKYLHPYLVAESKVVDPVMPGKGTRWADAAVNMCVNATPSVLLRMWPDSWKNELPGSLGQVSSDWYACVIVSTIQCDRCCIEAECSQKQLSVWIS